MTMTMMMTMYIARRHRQTSTTTTTTAAAIAARAVLRLVIEHPVAAAEVEAGHGVLVRQFCAISAQAPCECECAPQAVHEKYEGDVEAQDPRSVPARCHQRLLGTIVHVYVKKIVKRGGTQTCMRNHTK